MGSEEIVSGEASVSFSEDFTVVVEAENGNVKEYTVSLNCPQINTELPVLHVRPDELITGKEYYVNTYVELFDKTPGSSGEGWWDSAEKGKIEMRGRGNSTWGLPSDRSQSYERQKLGHYVPGYGQIPHPQLYRIRVFENSVQCL